MKPILEIHSISKKFSINHEQQPYLSLRDSISGMFKNKTSKEDFWALKDVSFNVMPGDTVGIIGNNGAGKSTLLKIISKITPPTTGKIIGRGRIASLLEVGTGFHPELTGRENVMMNGSILGMRKAEILKNFDEIVDFAGVEKFIDTPLKHYSSGMQLRLAFAVAAFLENEILIIDEVLAVGDAEFQKKCLSKMEDVNTSKNRTVLFVSHNITAVESFCNKGVHLHKGQVMNIGEIKEVTGSYINSQKTYSSSGSVRKLFKNKKAVLENIFLNASKKASEILFYRSTPIDAVFELNVLQAGKYNISVHFKTIKNEMICNFYTQAYDLEIGIHKFCLHIPENFLNDEMYKMDVFIVENASIPLERVNDLARFEIIDDSDRIWFGKFEGVIRPDLVKFLRM